MWNVIGEGILWFLRFAALLILFLVCLVAEFFFLPWNWLENWLSKNKNKRRLE